MSMPIYLDHNATTPVHPEILENLGQWAQFWGNPSSVHKASREPRAILRETRKSVSEMFQVHPLEIIFTAGGSESNNTAIKGVYFALQKLGRNHFITSMVEHPSVIKTFQFLEKLGAQVDYVPVNKNGDLDLDFYNNKLSEKTALVSIMLANNETGVIHPIKHLCELAHQKGVLFHTDAVQALGKMEVNLKDLNVDLASFSAHKFYSLRGTGILYQKRGTPLENLIHGGGQERARRAGTENILSIASLGYMTSKKDQIAGVNGKIKNLRDFLEKEITEKISNVQVIAKDAQRLPNTLSLFIDEVDGESLLMNLDMHGVCVSTGAACSSGSQEPSPVLRAMGFTRREAQSSLRISLGWHNTHEQMIYFLETLEKVVKRIRSFHKENTTSLEQEA